MTDRINIAGKELIFAFDTQAWVDLEAQFGSMGRMQKRFDEDLLPMTTGLQLAAITATAGTCDRDNKKAETISFAWLVKHAKPSEVQEIIAMAKMAVVRGLATTEAMFDEGDVDAALEENDAKKERADA